MGPNAFPDHFSAASTTNQMNQVTYDNVGAARILATEGTEITVGYDIGPAHI